MSTSRRNFLKAALAVPTAYALGQDVGVPSFLEPQTRDLVFPSNNTSLDERVSNATLGVPAKTEDNKWGYLKKTLPRTIVPPVPEGQQPTLCSLAWIQTLYSEELTDCPPEALVTYITLSQCAPSTWVRDIDGFRVGSRIDPNWLELHLKSNPERRINNVGKRDPAIPDIFADEPKPYQSVSPADFNVYVPDYKVLPVSVIQAQKEESFLQAYLFAEAAPHAEIIASRVGTTQKGYGIYDLTVKRVNRETQDRTTALKARFSFNDGGLGLLNVSRDGYDFQASKNAGTSSIFFSPKVENGYWKRNWKVSNEDIDPAVKGYSSDVSTVPFDQFDLKIR